MARRITNQAAISAKAITGAVMVLGIAALRQIFPEFAADNAMHEALRILVETVVTSLAIYFIPNKPTAVDEESDESRPG